MRNLGRRDEFNEGVELSKTSKQGYHLNEKPENSEHLNHLVFRSTTRSDKYKPEEEKKLVKKNLNGEIPAKEYSTNAKEINNTDIEEIKPDSKDSTPGGWKKVLPRRKKSQKQTSPSNQTSKTETNGNESFLQNQYDRFKSSEQRRTYSNNCQQKKSLSNVSDRKGKFFAEPKKKYLNKNHIHTSIQYSSRSSNHSSNGSQSGQSELDEASVKICISTSNEESTIDKMLNSGESVAQTMPEESNTKTLMKRSKKSTNCQLKNKNSPSNDTLTLADEQNKVPDSTTYAKEHAYSNIEDKLQQNNGDSDDVLKPKQCNSKDRIEPKVHCGDILIHESFKQWKLNVYAKEFSPVDNQSIHGIKCSKEQRKEISNCPNVKNLNDKITEHQQNAECPDLIKDTVRLEENAEQISTTCETDRPNESAPKTPGNQFYQNLTFQPQPYVLPETPEQSFINETQGPNEYEIEFTYSSNSDQNEHNEEPTFVFPERSTGVNQNDFNGLDTSTTNSNMQSQPPGFQRRYNGTVYFHYPHYNFGNYVWHNLFLNDQRNYCPYCSNTNSFMRV